VYISPYCRLVLVPPIFIKLGIRGQLTDIITYVKCLVDRFSGYGVLTPQNCHFPLTCCVALTTVWHYRATLWSTLVYIFTHFAIYTIFRMYRNICVFLCHTYVSSVWEHRWHRHTATCKDQKLTSVLMNASATSTSSRHPRNVCDTSDRAIHNIVKLRQHLLLPRHLSVHISTTWRCPKASSYRYLTAKTFICQIGLLHRANIFVQ